jgi:hypothetical protein
VGAVARTFIVCITALMVNDIAEAQSAGVVSLSASKTSSSGSLQPTLTWSTAPAATTCRASGGWSGTKAASGSQVIATINATTSYTLTCDWGSGSVTVRWDAPTANTDGSPLTDLAKFKIVYGTSQTALNRSTVISDPARRSHTLGSLGAGTWYFAVRAINSSNLESGDSNLGSKRVTAASASRSLTISIPPPPAGRLRTVATTVWDVQRRADGMWVRRAVVGTIALEKPCSTAFRAGQYHFVVNRSDTVLTSTPASSQLVVKCEPR